MKFLFAVLAIVFAAGSAFTPAKKKAVDEKKWYRLDNTAYPELASSYVLTTPPMKEAGENPDCPFTVSTQVCAIYVLPDAFDASLPDAGQLADIVDASDHFTEQLENETLEYIIDEQ